MGNKLNLGPLEWVLLVLLVVGGLNWGLVGLFQYDLVATIFGEATFLAKLVYVLVGISAVYYLLKALMSIGRKSS